MTSARLPLYAVSLQIYLSTLTRLLPFNPESQPLSLTSPFGRLVISFNCTGLKQNSSSSCQNLLPFSVTLDNIFPFTPGLQSGTPPSACLLFKMYQNPAAPSCSNSISAWSVLFYPSPQLYLLFSPHYILLLSGLPEAHITALSPYKMKPLTSSSFLST